MSIVKCTTMDINRATLCGRLTRDPEARTTPQGTNVTSFGLATNFIYTNQEGQKVEQVEYHNVVMWRKLAEIAAQYLRKGRRVLIEGRLQTRSWDAADGTKRQRTEIVADNLIMLDSAMSRNAAVEEKPSVEEALPVEESSPTATKKASDPEEISVEDIPF